MIKIFELEKALLSSKVRRSRKALDLLIADNFIEFGKSGKVWNKGDILASLPMENEMQYEIVDFAKIFESEHLICVLYKLNENSIISLRSSIWKFIDKRWQIIFHQGTAL